MYTKGPWRFEESTRTIRSVPENYWLAIVDSWDGAIDNEANANLIAAAPDMFEALGELLANAPAPKNIKQDYSYILRREMARAALAKARGET